MLIKTLAYNNSLNDIKSWYAETGDNCDIKIWSCNIVILLLLHGQYYNVY